jgi:hypothetical protein
MLNNFINRVLKLFNIKYVFKNEEIITITRGKNFNLLLNLHFKVLEIKKYHNTESIKGIIIVSKTLK